MTSRSPAPRDEQLVTIMSFPTSFEAGLAKGALEVIGIEAFVPDDGLGSFTRNRGGVASGALQVFESDRERAIAELRRLDIKVVSRN
jgi:hypothetical protein